MAVASTSRRSPLRWSQIGGRDRLRGAWVLAGTLFIWQLVMGFVSARVNQLGPFDDGIEFTTATYLLHGVVPVINFYEPYGIGLGIPALIPHLLGFDGAFAMRLTYSFFPALTTLLLVPLMWRRCGWKAALLVGLVSLTSNVPRYSMGFSALFGFALLVDRAARRTATGSLREAASRHPGKLVVAGAVLSLAGWARMEYAIFALLWAVVLALVLRGRWRWRLPAITAVLALLPTLIVLVGGGARQLLWIIRYNTSSASSGFRAQRGNPIEWHLAGDRASELVHLHLGSSDAAVAVGTYGVGLATVVAAAVMLALPRGRARLLRGDPTYLVPFMAAVCAFVLYAQSARFSSAYGEVGAPVFWAAGALLVAYLPAVALALIALVLAYPLLSAATPWAVANSWSSRPSVTNRPRIALLDDIPIPTEIELTTKSMAALIPIWRQLGLQGRATVSVERRNDVAWGNDAIVGFLLNAPPAAWPLTYDPGLVNTGPAERQTVSELCRDRDPVVQQQGDYGNPSHGPEFIGSRALDQFLAVDYRPRAVAGYYRILLPATPRCELPDTLSDATLVALRDRLVVQGELPEAGALAIALMDRARRAGRPPDPADAATAALGGYRLTAAELPPDPLGLSLLSLVDGIPRPGLTQAAVMGWPSDLESLAAQTAWILTRPPGAAGAGAVGRAVLALALRHPDWPQAIQNLAAVVPPDQALLRRLMGAGAAGIPQFDEWRRDTFARQRRTHAAIAAGLDVIADYLRADDPVDAANAEVLLSTIKGVDPGCVLLLRRSAAEKPGSGPEARAGLPAAGGPRCRQPEFARAAL